MDTHPFRWLREQLAGDLQRAGFHMVREENHPDDFGSAFAEYANQRCEIRLVWDGKEGWAVFEMRPTGTPTWSGLAGVLTEGDLEGDVIQTEKVDQWRIMIQGLAT